MDNFVNVGKQFLQQQLQNNNHGAGGGPQNAGGNSDGPKIAGFGINDIQNVIGNAQQHNQQDGGHDEDQNLVNIFKKVAGGGNDHHSSDIGQAAALSAIKDSFAGGGNNGAKSQDDLMGEAMSFASKGDKQDAISKAKETVAKLYIKHQINSAIGGGGSSSLNGLLTKMI